MGTISKGILGGFNGTVGTVIGGSWKGIEYMRSRPAKRTNNPSQAQLEQQAKFAVVISFLETMVGLLRITYKNFAVKMTAFNQTIYTTNGGARNAGAGSLNVSNMAGQTVQTYIGFISEDGKDVATSIYTGELSL